MSHFGSSGSSGTPPSRTRTNSSQALLIGLEDPPGTASLDQLTPSTYCVPWYSFTSWPGIDDEQMDLSKFPTPSVLADLVGFHSNRRNRCLHVYLSDPREQPPHAFVTRLRVDFRRAPRRSVWDYDVDFVTETLAYSVYVDELAAEAVDHQLDNTLLVHAREVDSRTDSPSLWDTQNETPDEESLLREYEAERRDDSDSTCSVSTVHDLGYGDLSDLSLEPKC